MSRGSGRGRFFPGRTGCRLICVRRATVRRATVRRTARVPAMGSMVGEGAGFAVRLFFARGRQEGEGENRGKSNDFHEGIEGRGSANQ